MKFSNFADNIDEIKQINSNIEKKNLVSKMLSDCDDITLNILPRFVKGQIFPDYDGRKLGISTSLIRKSISESTEIEEEKLKSKMPEVSDLGELFDIYNISKTSGQQTLGQDDLTIADVYNKFEKIAETSGSGSQKEKIDILVSMYSQCTTIEAKYLTRLANDNLSIGVGEGTVRKAISDCYNVSENLVERAIMFKNDIGVVAQIANEGGENALENVNIDICKVPLKPMKAKKKKVKDVLGDMDQDWVYGEYKYDGFRIQVHKSGDNVRLYTNSLEDVTDSLPDIVKYVKENIDAENIILDGEIVGYETDNYDKPLEYRKTQKRIRRKHNIQEMIDEIPIIPKFFDVLYKGDKSLIDNQLKDRKNILTDVVPDRFLVEGKKCYTEDDIQDVITNAENDGHEGAMTKDPESKYEPNKRGVNWLKLKPEGETIDAVVIGGEYGDGKRSDDISTYKMALWDNNELVGIGSVGNGFTDDEYEELTEKLSNYIISQDGRELDIRPEEVFEIKFEGVQVSPKYESGYGLRFPRVINRRFDKSVDEADTVSRLEDISDQL